MNQTLPALSRRALLLAMASAPFLPSGAAQAQAGDSTPRPFKIDVPQATIDRILARRNYP